MSDYNKGIYARVNSLPVNKSRFDGLTHEWKSQIVPGYIIPCSRPIQTLPGDYFKINSEFLFRFSPLYFPIMHKMTMRADYVYCPYRIVWPHVSPTNKGWKSWITEQEEYVAPFVNVDMERSGGFFNRHVLGFMGVPMITAGAGIDTEITNLNAFPLSIYVKFWDRFIRNPNLQEERWFPLDVGDNTDNFEVAFDSVGTKKFLCFRSQWEKDYLTSALPSPQIGETVQIPLMTEGMKMGTQFRRLNDTDAPAGDLITNGGGVSFVGADEVYADIQENSATMLQLYEAEVLQKYYTALRKFTQRYPDYLEGMWNEKALDGLIDEPTLIGSKFGRVQITDTMTTASTNSGGDYSQLSGDYQGNARMYSEDNDDITYKCPEHGCILVLIQLNANTSYGQGIDRYWRYQLPTDYPLAMFSTIGDQEILKEEVVYNPYTADIGKGQETFGYIERWAEARYLNNLHVMNLNFLNGVSQHLGRIWDMSTLHGVAYDTTIEINERFVEVGIDSGNVGDLRITDTFRVLPRVAEDGGISGYVSEGIIFAHVFHTIVVDRALPVHSIPGLS